LVTTPTLLPLFLLMLTLLLMLMIRYLSYQSLVLRLSICEWDSPSRGGFLVWESQETMGKALLPLLGLRASR